ncbi:hypothetical protein [uncultured Aquimarina sp.]|uniref:hypothetical protein n=1 Tax=uncultured Aquimarina sp. TaxID=575652 RepID=UPI00262C5B34|nr:hypothetical protein [uncultured Aquimarina sp.]
MKKINNYSYVVTFIWIGFLLAISFMEAPLKFQAESVTTAIGVEIGKIIFRALNTIELIFSVFLVLQIRYIYKLDKRLFFMVLFLLIIVVVQSFCLLPILDRYADIVISGGSSPSNTAHIVYVFFEVIKLFLLFFVGFRQLLLFKRNIERQE